MNYRFSTMTAGIWMLIAVGVFPASAPGAGFESVAHLYQREDAGMRHYERGDFAQAFDDLSHTAVRGLKRSQYMLSFMFMKGQHVNKSTLLGLGWLGVAKESGEREWVEQFDKIYAVLTPQQQQIVDRKVQQYVDWYGMAAQNVQCSKRHSTVGSRRRQATCLKVEGERYEIHPIELTPGQ